MKSRDIAALETTLAYHFPRAELLEQALTHSSQARELESLQPAADHTVGDNEQLEFLGDAVLGFVTTQELFHRFPMFREGELSKLRAHLVSERHLIRVAQELEIGHYLRLGRGEEKSGGRNKPALLADALEAVLAAIYLDGGLEPARQLILQRIVTPELDRVASHGKSSSDRLQIGTPGAVASFRAPPAVVSAGERTRPGTQQDLYGGDPVATFREEWTPRVCRPRGRIDQEERGTGCGPPSAGVSAIRSSSCRCTGQAPRALEVIMAVADKSSPTDTLSSLQSLLATVVIAVFVITFVVQAFQIPSESMENTLLIGDYLLVDKLRYGGNDWWEGFMPYRPVRRGDIIVFRYPVNPAQHFVKRVVGVPGDRLRLINRQVYVNGDPLREPYVHYNSVPHDAFRDDFPRLNVPVPGLEGDWWLEMRKLVEDDELIVPEGQYFVLGDNRDDSKDSRYWGFVPRENIVGRPLLIYWSVRSAEPDVTATTPGDRLFHFAYAVSHLFQMTRWDRTFRLVN